MTIIDAQLADRASFDEAVAAAQAAAAAYYDTGEATIPDADYDALVERIEAAKTAHPDWDDQGLTEQVAGGASAGGDVVHPEPMLSLGKTKTLADIEQFVARASSPIVVEVKLDGMAVRVEYVDGRLALAATRGNGASGEDVTAQVARGGGVSGLPVQLASTWTGEVRGEIYMRDSDFETANANRVAFGKPAFVNPRNATAGSLRKADPDYEAPMSFAAYDATGDEPTYSARMAAMAALGFRTALSLAPHDPAADPAQVVALIEAIEAARPTLGSPIDGAVVKVDSYADRDILGFQSRAPRWATAFKYAADTATTKLLGVEVSVGRTGRLGFRLQLEPVFVGGTTVAFAAGHNAPWLLASDLRVGDTVWVYRAGDVIPRVTTADLALRPAGAVPWEAPDACPQCGEALDRSSLLWRCHTPTCSAAGWLDYWASGEALDVDRLGTSICEALVEEDLASNPADLYDLTVEQLAALPVGVTTTGAARLLGSAIATDIVANLERSKEQPLNRVITGLGIRGTGRSVGRWLAGSFRTMDALRAASVEEIAEIEKLGPIKAQLIVDGLAKLGPMIDRLAAHGLAMAVAETGEEKTLAGRTYVISGSIPGFARAAAQERIEQLGGKASGSVGKATTALITSETTTSKAVKAAQLGVPIIDPAEFAKLLA